MLSNEESKFHEKIAIFEDYEGNYILTIGSTNATGSGYKHNRDSIAIQESWRENNVIIPCLQEFNTLWNNEDPFAEVYPLPVAVKEKLLEIAPKDPNYRFNRRKKSLSNNNHSLDELTASKPARSLYEYQQCAIDKWVASGYKGILNMATGTGKTFTALNAIKQSLKSDAGLLLIVAPQREIANQWADDVRDIFGNYTPILMCNSDARNSSWKKNIGDFLHLSLVEFRVLIVTNASFSSEFFFDSIHPYLKKMLIIIDEVHSIGAPKSREKLVYLGDIPKRLGLSATPERMRDVEGNEAISSFFGSEV